jgi:adenylate cyclase
VGEHSLKNIDQPIHVWKWHPADLLGKTRAPITPSSSGPAEIPSLAVLPFQNMSGDAEQDYFADGVVEDLITALSRFRSFAVIARNSSFVYKGRAVDIRQVARELGCRYVVEGSVRRAGARLRITAQLIDGVSGSHLWAHNFDGTAEEIFDVQDRITERVVAIVEPKIQQAEVERSRRERPESLEAYDLYLQGLRKMNTLQPEGNAAAYQLLSRAIAIEPSYAIALATAAHCLEYRLTMGWPLLGPDDEQRSLQLARAALELAGGDAMVLARCAIVIMQVGNEYEQGLRIFKRALEVNPHNVFVLSIAGIGHLITGRTSEALEIFHRVIQLSPGDTFEAMTGIAHVNLQLRRFEEGLAWGQRSLAENPSFNPTHWAVIACNAHLGRLSEAQRALASLQALVPRITLTRLVRPGKFLASDELMIEGLRLAGMPEA